MVVSVYSPLQVPEDDNLSIYRQDMVVVVVSSSSEIEEVEVVIIINQ